MTSWHHDAACRDKPLNTFYPDVGINPDEAKTICAACPVRQECLEFALTTGQQYGIWGGQTPAERQGQRSYRVIFCNECGRRFTWKPADWTPPPRFCSATCRRAARLKVRQKSYINRGA